MALKCPKCGNQTLDWKALFNCWKCVKVDCDYQRKRTLEEKNPHIISIFGDKNEN